MRIRGREYPQQAMADVQRTPRLEARFWAKVKKGDGCWEWQGRIDRKGYGMLGVGYGQRIAHRLAWWLTTGAWPDSGVCVCHHCDNRKCVRPDHLFLGTHKDNASDMRSKNRQAHGERNSQAKLTSDQVQTVREVAVMGLWTRKQIAHEFGVTVGAIEGVLYRRNWRAAQ